ncbi:MAG: type II CRISPR RNA-guided endonuclease Cas9 [Balneolaceae bacterium]|nr:type II CRISPR RNA-guided endonuclease Cas9 [Balneolaceae bacterium]
MLDLTLENGYGRFSQKAISKLLPLLKDGLRENGVIKEVYGNKKEDKEKLLTFKLPMPPKIKNPVVYHALIELRKVVNAIIRTYGLPDTIRVELARELKNSKKRREHISKKQGEYKKKNKQAIKALKQEPHSIQEPSRTDIIRYKLWKECKEICPYTGKTIPPQALFSGEIEVEHILPFSRTLDDSFMNKTLSYSSINAKKGNRTPWECVEAGIIAEDDLLQRIRKLPWKKRRKFTQKEIQLDDFISRQLNDTRYISREAKKYLSKLGSEEWPVKIQIAKGQSTALLRHLWSLNSILNHDGDEIKNREDHRHHSVDALVVALTTPSILKKLSDENKKIDSAEWMEEGEGAKYRNNELKRRAKSEKRVTSSYPWPSFRKDAIDAINSIIVSHRVSRKVSGSFHEDTYYGTTESKPTKKRKEMVAVRKPVHELRITSLTNDVKCIKDPGVRNIIKSEIQKRMDNGLSQDKAIQSFEENPPCIISSKATVPIRKVRLEKEKNSNNLTYFEDKKGEVYKYAIYGNNHHIAIYEKINSKGDKTVDEVVVPTMEAARRIKDKEKIVMRDHPEFSNFLYSLSINESVKNLDNGKLYRVQMIKTDKRIQLSEINLVSSNWQSEKILSRPRNLNIRKVKVDPIGKVYPAND